MKPQAVVDACPDGLEITVRPRRRLLLIGPALLGMWLWLAIAPWDSPGGSAYEWVVWFVPEVAGLAVVVWALIGREAVRVAAGELTLTRAVGPFRRRRDIPRSAVEDVHATDDRGWSWIKGAVAFDCGARTYRFGAALDRTDAKQLVQRIEEALRA